MVVSLKKKPVIRTLYLGIIVLLFAHLAVHLVEFTTGHDFLFGLTPFLDFYGEANLPTWYSTLLLVASSLLLLAVFSTRRNNSDKYYWLVLSFVFVYLSLDEFAQLHELFGSYISKTKMQSLLPNESSSAWIFWGGAMSLIIAVSFFRFWWKLSKPVRRTFLVAALVYVGGALGFEIIEVFYVSRAGEDYWFFAMVTIEETMEMLGVVIFIGGLLEQLLQGGESFEIRLLSK